jgi:dTDP-4-amino-4,6-dideoxygalactose transaminase
MVKFLDLKQQYELIKSDIDKAIASVISETAFVGGKYVQAFETSFAEYCQVEHCLGVGNGTDALEIAIEALDIPQGSEIIVPANSFVASSEAVTRAGCKVAFADINPENYTLSPASVSSLVTPNTKAIMAVHLYGHPCDMDALQEIADQHGLKIIEDCAQAHGAAYKGRRVGGIGDAAAFSFYPGKNLGAYGDGGAITTNCNDTYVKAKMIANHGRIDKYNHEFEGRNSRLDGLQAAILSAKLPHLDSWTENRIRIADYYLEKLSNIEAIKLPKRESWAKQVYHLFVAESAVRDSLKEHLAANNIQSGVHYPISLPELNAYTYIEQNFSGFYTHGLGDRLLSIPIGDHLDLNSASEVVDAVAQFHK